MFKSMFEPIKGYLSGIRIQNFYYLGNCIASIHTCLFLCGKAKE